MRQPAGRKEHPHHRPRRLNNPISAKALWPVCNSREQAALWQPNISALSGSDRHDFAVSQGPDIANWRPAKETPVFAIELARTFNGTRVSNCENRCSNEVRPKNGHSI
jgi:hypothetical protein